MHWHSRHGVCMERRTHARPMVSVVDSPLATTFLLKTYLHLCDATWVLARIFYPICCAWFTCACYKVDMATCADCHWLHMMMLMYDADCANTRCCSIQPDIAVHAGHAGAGTATTLLSLQRET